MECQFLLHSKQCNSFGIDKIKLILVEQDKFKTTLLNGDMCDVKRVYSKS